MSVLTGLGLGWRPETAWLVDQRADIHFTEVLAENLDPSALPLSLRNLRSRGVPIVPHGVGLSLGSATKPESKRLDHLARLAEALEAPFVSEHVAFVRASELDSGHLLPIPRTFDALEIVIENVLMAQQELPVPLVLENIAAVFEWPNAELTEGEFLRRLFDATGAGWLFDAANLHTNVKNLGWNPTKFLDEAPLDRIRYVHIAGGVERNGVYHDTHAHPLGADPLRALAAVLERTGPRPVLLERDRDFGEREGLEAELDAVNLVLRGAGATHAA